MVREIRREDPLYNCTVSVEEITGNKDEEIIAFGTSAEEAKNKAEAILKNDYECEEAKINELMAAARIEIVSTWCSVNRNRD
ncbi:MAG: hypothetical protein ACFBSE_21805 [Prochloraceae cyanobacterium]